MSLRNTALAAFAFVILGTLLDWFEFTTPFTPSGFVFTVSGLDIQQRGETIILFAIAGAVFTLFGRGLTALIVPALAAAMALIVVLYTYSDPYPLHEELVVLEGFYLTLVASLGALVCCLLRLPELLRAERIDFQNAARRRPDLRG